MTAFLIFVIKSAFTLALLVSLFMAFMSRETFHRLNRYLLLGVVVCALVLPAVNLGFESPFSRLYEILLQADDDVRTGLSLEDFNGFELGNVTMTAVSGGDTIPTQPVDDEPLNWLMLVFAVYVSGVAVLLVRQFVVYVRLARMIRSAKPVNASVHGLDGIRLRVHCGNEKPFSWFGWVVVSQEDMDDAAREILVHEAAHARAGHSWDIMFADAVIILQWFNPLAWIMKIYLKDVHEFEADEAVIASGVDAKRYQQLIIKKAVGARLYSIANSFNHSLTKKRITMMCKEKSKKWKCAKALYVLPVVVAVACSFSTAVSANATENETASKGNEIATNETNVFGKKVVEDSKIFGHFSLQDPNNSNEKLCVCLEEQNGEVYGVVFGTTDEFTVAREGYEPGYFDRPMKEVSLKGDVLTFTIYADDGEFYASPQGCAMCLEGTKLHFSETAPKDDKYGNSDYFKGLKVKYVLDMKNGELTSYGYPYNGDTLRLNKQVRKFTIKSREERKVKRMVDENGETVYQVVEQQPQFPGGEQALNEYFKKNVKVDANVTHERPVVGITVKKDGTITDARLLQSSGVEAIDNEVLRVVRDMPKWTPGKLGNESVNTVHVFPVNFTFEVKQVPEVMAVEMEDKDMEHISDLDVTVVRYQEKAPGLLMGDNLLVVVNDTVFDGELDFPASRIASVHVMELSQLPEKWYDKCEEHGKEGIVFIDLKDGETLSDVVPAKKEVKPQAKGNTASKEDEKVFMVVEQQPEFPGGMPEMMKYLMRNVKYPDVARNALTQGRVFVEFIVHKDGSIDDVKAVGGKYSVIEKDETELEAKYDELNNEFKTLLEENSELEYKYVFAADDKERDSIRSKLNTTRDKLNTVKRKISGYLPQIAQMDETNSGPDRVVYLTEMNDATNALRAEALRVVKSMPAWKPGMQSGKPVAVRMTLPVAFKIQ